LLVILTRTIILLLLICGLADPQYVTRQVKQEERIFAFDISQSMTNSMRRWMGSAVEAGVAPPPGGRGVVFCTESKTASDRRRKLEQSGGPAKTNQRQKNRPGKDI